EIICVLLIAITISIILTSIFKSKIIVSQKEYFRIYSDVESNFIDTFKGIAEIKVFNKQLSFQTQTKNLYNKLQYNYLKLSGLNLRFSTISEFSNTMLTVVVIVITSDMFFANELKLGELISILAMSNIVLPTFSRVSISYMQVQEALIAFDRMYEFTSLKGENEGSELIIEEIKLNFIQLKNVSFKFAGHKNILSDISFNFNRGEITCLYGASGKGKSTLLQILQKLQASYDGKIIINEDIDFKSIEISQWRSLLGSVNQAPKVFKGSLLFNITLDNDPIKLSSAISFCQSHGFSKYINEIPNGYNCIIGEGGIKLSGGQIQLLCIARALFINPQLLLLDEPTSAMDSEMENFVLSLIKSVKKDKLILIISHQHSIIEECDRIIKI
ncbi:MAG: ATP-binding cassette domain-containing protein, partial [bacterium]